MASQFPGKYSSVFEAPTFLGNVADFEALINKAPEAERERLRTRLIEGQIEGAQTARVINAINRPQYDLQEMEEFRRREAERANLMGQQNVEKAFQLSMLKNIPETIANSFATAAGIKLQSAKDRANILTQLATNIPSINVPGFSYQPTKYFG